MRIDTHGANRKLLAQAISEHIHEPVHYTFVPRCAYLIGDVAVEKDGSINTENADAWAALMPFFTASGWEEEAQAQMQEHLETLTETAAQADEQPAAPGTENKREAAPADSEADGPAVMNLNFRLETFTDVSLKNFLRALYTRQKLINAMMRTELIRIDEELITLLHDLRPDTVEAVCGILMKEVRIGLVKGVYAEGDFLHIDLRYDPGEDTAWTHCAALFNRLFDSMRGAHHVSGKLIDPEETAMKYFCHSWLISLGFEGPDHKELRAALLNRLPGFAAFRTAEKMNAHKTKFIERRRQARAAEREAHTDDEN